MGLPNSDKFLSKKDLNSLEFNIFSRPKLEFQQEIQTTKSKVVDINNEEQGRHNQQHYGFEKDEKREVLVTSLRINLPSCGDQLKLDDDGYEECTTPTSPDHKIQVLFPPAPRKPKTLPSAKRKGSTTRMFLDLSKEVELLFPPALLADHLGGTIKKIRRASSCI